MTFYKKALPEKNEEGYESIYSQMMLFSNDQQCVKCFITGHHFHQVLTFRLGCDIGKMDE